jgi:hypothetical protein
MPEKETGKTSPASEREAKGEAKAKVKPVVSVKLFQALSSRFDALEERFNRLVKSHRFQF